MVELKSLAVGSLVGAAIFGLGYVDGIESLQFVGVLGLVWAIAGWSLARNHRVWREADTLPSLLFILLAVGVPQFGTPSALPLGDFRAPIMLLAMGIAVAGMGLGMEMNNSESIEEEPTTAAMSAD
ncbi:hypothetical protein [Saliphagus infecundisoli]|uniref:SPW repeat-containing protein n=1 Tax=Saliphagus infecundisoli TaxID=1849069 RepID=A0ABD5Q9N4_9EURY|nr:hypothetical protein [Saliphagus infecundisoli]